MNHRIAAPLALSISAIFTSTPAYSQEEPQPDPSSALGSVEIRARRAGPLASTNVLSSVDILQGDLLRETQVNNTWELFSRAPGIMLTPFRQGNESGKLSFRGFNGEGEVNAVKLLIDGIPANDNAGGMPFLDMLFPLEIDNIEVVRGTNDARYGLHNIAGNVTVNTRQGGNDGAANISIGSFGTRQVQLAKGIEDGNWAQNYFAGRLESNGYRANAAFDKTTFGGKWWYRSDDARLRVGVNLRHTESHGDEAGYLTYAESRTDPAGSMPYARSTGGNRQMTQASLQAEVALSDRLSLAASLYLNRVHDQRWLRYSPATSQQERIIGERHAGLTTTLTYRPPLAGVTLEGGVNAERQHDESPRYNTVDKVRVATTREQRFSFDTNGAYLQAVLRPALIPGLKIVPAYRVDKVGGDFHDPSKNVSYGIQHYGLIKQPKLGLVYAPSPVASLYGNWGRSFQVGAGAAAYKSSLANLSPSINDGWESGVKFTPAGWIDGRVAIWRQDASGEVKRRLNDPNGDLDNVGKTRRDGLDFQLNLRPNSRNSVWLAYSHQSSRIVEPDPTAPATLGKQIDHVPQKVFSAGYTLHLSPAITLSAWGNGQGDYYLTTANSGAKFGAYTLLNASASYLWSPGVKLELQLKNLAGRYTEYVWLNDQSRHAPGDGRAAYLSANLTF